MSAGLEIFSRSMWQRTYRCHRQTRHSRSPAISKVAGVTPPSRDDAKKAGRQALSGLKGTLAQRIAGVMRRDPELLSEMVELGLVRREWLENPAREQMSTARPMEVAERWL